MTKKIAFQGTQGAYSHIACNRFYPNHKSIACSDFQEVFEKVANDEVEIGIVPLENSYAGRVAEVHHLLYDSKVNIIAENFLKIEHHLAILPEAEISDIKEIYSHQQALMQCRENLKKLPAKKINFTNTAKAAQFVKNEGDKSKAAICSVEATKLNGLKISQSNMEDKTNYNYTIFITISKKEIYVKSEKNTITTMIFTARNIPGALYKAIGGFAPNSINILKLESYIPCGFSQESKFFISIEGNPEDEKVARSLEEMGFFSKEVKLLGVYEADDLRYSHTHMEVK
jgi:prephenate dehydratase